MRLMALNSREAPYRSADPEAIWQILGGRVCLNCDMALLARRSDLIASLTLSAGTMP
jgi:hypothetical protein